MNVYEKPNAEIISFESESIMDNAGIDDTPSIGVDVEVWP